MIHTVAIGIAFIACGVVMYLLPRMAPVFSVFPYRWVSWGLGMIMAVSVYAGTAFIPAGCAQRLAATALLIWIAIVAKRLRQIG